jgi:DNA-binding PadR family transcriptional regulator
MAILGLLVERPDTGAGLGLRLNEVFPRARWPRNVVHGNMPSLLKQGLVRLVAKGQEPALDRYEATERGIARFRAWVRQSTTLPPVLRDGLQGRLRFVEREELASLVGTVRDCEAACSLEYAAAHGRLKSARRLARRPGEAQPDWRSKLRLIQVGDEAMLWGMMVRRLQHLGDELEALLGDDSTCIPSRESGDD